jgi:5-dehydro-4-deoxyglucarate dehydratase
VLAGVGGGVAIAREFLAVAREEGVDGVLLLPPYLVRPAQAGLVEWVRQVVGGSGVPAIAYRRDNAAYDAATTVRLLDVPEVVGLKDGVGDVEAMAAIRSTVRVSGHPRAAEFLFLNGLPTAEVWALPYRSIGVPLYSSAVHCFAPDLSHRFHDALVAGDHGTCEVLLDSFFVPLTALRDEAPGYAVSLVKAAARLSGQQVGSVRPPLVDPPAEHLDRLTDLLAAGRRALRAVAG